MVVQTEQPVLGIDELCHAILSQAREQAQEHLRQAQERVSAIHEQAEKEALTAKDAILEETRRGLALEKQRALAAAELEVRQQALKRREEQIAQVFEAAGRRLEELRRSTAYSEVLRLLIREAAETLGNRELLVSVVPEDAAALSQGLLDQIARELGAEALRLGAPAVGGGGGAIVSDSSGRMRVDNTFAQRLERSKDLLRSAVHDMLTQER